MPTFPGSRGEVHYREWLATDPVASYVFLHGFGEHSGLYDRFAAALNGSRISVWAVDQIGHGLSAGERGLVESLDDLVTNGRTLAGIAVERQPDLPLFVAGHSLGGVTTALTLARYPADYAGVVLSGTPLTPLPWVNELAASGATELELDTSDLSSDAWYVAALRNDPLSFTAAPVARSIGGTLPPAWIELADGLAGIETPLLLVHGADDPLVPIEDVRASNLRLANSRLREFSGARHDVLNDISHDDVARVISDFVLSIAAVTTQ